ncbi:RagB/SusD family nutrient uptake outer membrane protein [Pedobacter sp. HMF7647]|uniref:RagB/SusD family nutrient uptake outer membrane protein n=1 Tax=Hufsiella arboris TaxID=2695275 RepID=A0A7K1YBU4_9SPHI|nr:RagB/SusD family nutrient uptake outer membrane protein [Hufsiella arboris]MXV51890.1 RagB/SusD family nutrient uptake outer membrane protein [Hufsiella arboris]
MKKSTILKYKIRRTNLKDRSSLLQKVLLKSALAITLFTSSCNKLDIQPEGFVTKEQFYKTEADANAGVTGIYNELVFDPGEQPIYGRELNFLTDMVSDDLSAGPSAINPNVRALSAITYVSSNDRLQVSWRQFYTLINRANLAIDQIPAISFDQNSKQKLIREAKFLRGLTYFNLVRLWGDVPLVLHDATSVTPSELKSSRVPKEQIYKQIVEDLTEAENLPTPVNNQGRATGGAAKALLAKVYLTIKDYDHAIAKAREVRDGGFGYKLFDKFSDVFNTSKSFENTGEHIFSAQFDANAGLGNGSSMMGANFVGFTTARLPADVPAANNGLYDLFQPGDTRRDVTFYTSIVNPATGTPFVYTQPFFGKYIDRSVLATPNQSNINFPVLRYADVLLILAEALNEKDGPTSEAYDAINQVHRRAFARPITSPDVTVDLSSLTQSSFRDALYLERRLEFVQEAQRWFDLVRTGRLVTALKKVPEKAGVSERNNLYPIPKSERDLNPDGLPQNPGYTD